MADERNFEPPPIDYRKFAAALDYYEPLGYSYLEVPWVISTEAVVATLPPGGIATRVQYGELVGSAEQAFIELILRGREVLKACAVTPCFRIENSYDELHHPYFMKLELINTDTSPGNLYQMINAAQGFFQRYIETDIEQTGPHAYDIVDKKRRIELGSYGIRHLDIDVGSFIYGTGLALPRFDTVLSQD